MLVINTAKVLARTDIQSLLELVVCHFSGYNYLLFTTILILNVIHFTMNYPAQITITNNLIIDIFFVLHWFNDRHP